MDTPEVNKDEIPQFREDKENKNTAYTVGIINNSNPGKSFIFKCDDIPTFNNGMYEFKNTNGKDFLIYPGNNTIIVTNENIKNIKM